MGHDKSIVRLVLLSGLAISFVGFIALGVWQLERRAWKLDLIERVESRMKVLNHEGAAVESHLGKAVRIPPSTKS